MKIKLLTIFDIKYIYIYFIFKSYLPLFLNTFFVDVQKTKVIAVKELITFEIKGEINFDKIK